MIQSASLLFISILFPFLAIGQSLFNESWKITTQTLSQKWELDEADQKGTFRIQSYKPIYVTAGRYSDRPNTQPKSENPNIAVPVEIPYNNWEAKFQLSFKSKIVQGLFDGKGDLWAAFTQKAHWQIYNTELSRPFRELNYEPELIFNYPLNIKMGEWRLRTIGGGFNHQSNGRALPLSRSWNRVTFHLGMESKEWQLTLRPWLRLPDREDENPELLNYVGRGEVQLSYRYNTQLFYAVITHPFNRLDRGSIQLNYVFPVKANLRLHFQLFSGYGETLIDYNHRQTTAGLGISFFDW